MKQITFNTEMVRAIRDNFKTMTRRVIKLPSGNWDLIHTSIDPSGIPCFIFREEFRFKQDELIKCPYGKPGDKFEVIEKENGVIIEDFLEENPTPVITDIRVERVQDITEEDLRKEGIFTGEKPWIEDGIDMALRPSFKILWNSIYGENAWKENKWVWVIEFKKEASCQKQN